MPENYQYIKGSGDLDMCNGRFTVTDEFPKGTYAYFLTEDWPVIPRYFKAEPLKLRGGPGHQPSHRGRFLPGVSRGYPGHLQTHSLPRPLGRQQVIMGIAFLAPTGAQETWRLSQGQPK